MALDSFDDLLRELRAHPEWQSQLRQLVLTDGLVALPETVAELAGAQQRTEEQLGRLAGLVGSLTERVDALTERVDALTERVDALTERMDALTERMDALTERMDALTERMDALTERMDALTAKVERIAELAEQTEVRLQGLIEQVANVSNRTDRAIGYLVEQQYRTKAHGYFQRIALRVHVLDGEELEDLLEPAVADGTLTFDQAAEIRLSDAVIRGVRDGQPVLLALEASAVVDASDVERAARRAHHLQATGTTALAVAAGERILPDAFTAARQLDVWLVSDGHTEAPAA